MAPSGGGELSAGVGATPFGLVEGSRYLCFAGGAVGEASGSGRVGWCGAVGLFHFASGGTGGLGLCCQRRIVRASKGRCWLRDIFDLRWEWVLGR